MNFLVIFCLETVVFSSFSNLEGLVGETGTLVKNAGNPAPAAFSGSTLAFSAHTGKGGAFPDVCGLSCRFGCRRCFSFGRRCHAESGLRCSGGGLSGALLPASDFQAGGGGRPAWTCCGRDCSGRLLSAVCLSGTGNSLRPDSEYGPYLHLFFILFTPTWSIWCSL